MNYDDWKSTEPDREELTEPDPPDCPECGAKHDEPCEPGCGCVHCRRREMQREREAQ